MHGTARRVTHMITRLSICLTTWQAGFVSAQEISLVPQPTQVGRQAGMFSLEADTQVVCTPQTRAEASWLKRHVGLAFSFPKDKP